MNPFVLIRPVITEKSLRLVKENNIYTFYVDPRANKIEIREAIEKTFEVKVKDLKTVTLPPSSKRTGKKRQRTVVPARKKAMALLPEGQKIEVFDL